MNRKDLQASTLVELNRENPVLDPLALQHFDKQNFGIFLEQILQFVTFVRSTH